MRIHPAREDIQIGAAAELEAAPRAIVPLGTAPDGLPWLLRVDRSNELSTLFSVVPNVFGLSRREDLPPRVLAALENDVAAGLMGVHEVDIDGPARGFVSRTKLKRLLGPTVMSQLLEPKSYVESDSSNNPSTNVGAMAARDQDEALLDAIDRSIAALRAKRHLLIDLAGGRAYSCSVRDTDRALRTPSAPIHPLAFESLLSVGAEMVVYSSAGTWRVGVGETAAVHATLLRAHQDPGGGWVRYRISRQRLLAQLVAVARSVDALHRRSRVHADLAPGNMLVCADGAKAFDGLDLEAGTPATAATFAWAAPEQIVGHVVDPRTDVYALGRIATDLLGGVVFGEQTNYVVPIGGRAARQVTLLKAEGVFVDISESGHDRAWQRAWQEVTGKSVAYDRDRRHATAGQFADELASVLERYPVDSYLELDPRFGDIVPVVGREAIGFAHLAND